MRNESECPFWAEVGPSGHYRPITILYGERFEFEHVCWDPKDGELCLDRLKPEETSVEDRCGVDVQIAR